jgi:hypothetical protein
MSGYDPERHFVTGANDLTSRLLALHDHAVIAWDRDAPSAELGTGMVVAPSNGTSFVDGLLILGYAVDGVGKIFRLVLDVKDSLGIRWIKYDRQTITRQKRAP